MTDYDPHTGEQLRPHPENMTPPEMQCDRYSWGHRVHFIQARLCREGGDRVPARILNVDGHYVEFETDAGTFRRWNHDPIELQRKTDIALSEPEATVLWSARYRMLSVVHGGVLYHLGLDEGDGTPCLFDD